MRALEPPHRLPRLAWKLGFASAGMLGFALFVLPPLYDAACRLFGINGKTLTTATATAVTIDDSRTVTVEFVAGVYQGTPLEFHAPRPFKLDVHPGQLREVTYTARNLTDAPLWAQAVHSVSPGETSRYVNVVQCFCFSKQKFAPREERKLTFAFRVSPELSDRHSTISVSYTFFKLENPPEERT